MINGSLIGNSYPFYLGNEGEVSCYLYMVVSPGITEKLDPIVSREKVGEITKTGDFQAKSNTEMMSADILAYLNGKSREGVLDYFKEMVNKNVQVIDRGESEFPGFVMKNDDPTTQQGLIVEIRDALRWKHYKFAPGSKVDILWNQRQFAVCRIEEGSTKDSIRLIPENLYSLTDVAQTNPTPIQLPEGYIPLEFDGRFRVSEMNRAIKKLEIGSFENE